MRHTPHPRSASIALAALLAATPALAAGPTLTFLAQFDAPTGTNPFAQLARDSHGILYGTTEFGGISGNENGTLFTYNPATHLLTAPLPFAGTNGANPIGTLLYDGKNSFYGTTRSGGSAGAGTLFQYSPASQTLTTLYSFDGSHGSSPYSGLIAGPKGNLYGTTNDGGTGDVGTVFMLNATTRTLTTLASFTGNNGANPFGGLVADPQGNLYGTTRNGGSNGMGTIFKITANTHTLTTLVNFNGTNGAGPTDGLLLGKDGYLYGTTVEGGKDDAGLLFRISSNGKSFTTLANFGNDFGQNPIGDLLADAQGNLYGTTQVGGPQGGGTVFKFSTATHRLSTLATFDNDTGWALDGGLLADPHGNLFGTTYYGGDNHSGTYGTFGNGTLFELSNTGFALGGPFPSTFKTGPFFQVSNLSATGTPSAGSSIPEPATLSLLALTLPFLTRRRRR